MSAVSSSIAREWQRWLLAVGFFTRIPVPSKAGFKEADLQGTAQYLPLIGILVGLVAGLAYMLVMLANLPPPVAVIASMAASLYLTGALHEDGLADSADGLGGGYNKEQALTIMQDSRLGTFGAIALILGLLLKFVLLCQLTDAALLWALVAGHSVSRLYAVLVMVTQPYAKLQGKARPLAHGLSWPAFMLAAFMGLVPLACGPVHHWWGLLPATVVWCWFSYKIHVRLDGYTGDSLGAMQQMTELAFYLGVVAVSVR